MVQQLTAGDKAVISETICLLISSSVLIWNDWSLYSRLGFIDGISDYNLLDDDKLRTYLESKVEEFKDVGNKEALDRIVECELKLNMNDSIVRSPKEYLFFAYDCILHCSGLAWLTTVHQKVAVQHVRSTI